MWPFNDPFWAIYWPGGQAISRYLMDNPDVCRGRSVLDLGSGCGASAIMAKRCGAEHVTANDIDTVAGVVTIMNSELNKLEPPVCSADNMISSEPKPFDLILLGDMFYDETLATTLHGWLDRCIQTHNTTVLIGDPGRAAFEGHNFHRDLHHLAQYELPQSVREENYGLVHSSVWSYRPRLQGKQ
uniref:Electron transfer flavoprotein beta subunit lysine methyltransferase n=2 Tax=Knipowitschia caucasica TaxID=637954 RepID=A0AAV2L4W8_KNICA